MANDLLGRRRIVARFLPKQAVGAEIGVFKGDFSQSILDVLQPQKLYLIDPWIVNDDPRVANSWYGPNSGNDMPSIMQDVVSRFQTQIDAGIVEVMRGASEERLQEIGNQSLDFAYVDGDHSYEGVKKDLFICHDKVRAGGFLVLDDYGVPGWWEDGILKAAHEFLGHYASHYEIKGANGGQLVLKKLKL